MGRTPVDGAGDFEGDWTSAEGSQTAVPDWEVLSSHLDTQNTNGAMPVGAEASEAAPPRDVGGPFLGSALANLPKRSDSPDDSRPAEDSAVSGPPTLEIPATSSEEKGSLLQSRGADANSGRVIDGESNADIFNEAPENGDTKTEAVDNPEGEATEDGGFDPEAAARGDHDAAVSDLRRAIVEITQEIMDLRAALTAARQERRDTDGALLRALQLALRHESDYRQLIALLDEMLEAGRGQGPTLGCEAVSTAQAVTGEAKRERKRSPGHAWDRIWHILKTVLRRIWSMISHLLAVKEWKVSGRAGNGLFGLAQVGIEITFGE